MQLIFARWVVPVEPDSRVLQDHCVVVKDDTIIDVLPSAEAREKYSSVADRFEGGEHHVVLPGFVNCHTHSAMTLLRGIADDLPLMPWLTVRVQPAKSLYTHARGRGVALPAGKARIGRSRCSHRMHLRAPPRSARGLRHSAPSLHVYPP